MNKSIGIFFFFISGFFTAQAQDSFLYENLAGIRIAPADVAISSSFSFKHRLMGNNTVEADLSVQNGWGASAYYMIQGSAPAISSQVEYYYGLGGFYQSSSNIVNLGAAGILGMEYSFERTPVNIALDWRPEFNIVKHTAFRFSGIGLSVRYIF